MQYFLKSDKVARAISSLAYPNGFLKLSDKNQTSPISNKPVKNQNTASGSMPLAVISPPLGNVGFTLAVPLILFLINCMNETKNKPSSQLAALYQLLRMGPTPGAGTNTGNATGTGGSTPAPGTNTGNTTGTGGSTPNPGTNTGNTTSTAQVSAISFNTPIVFENSNPRTLIAFLAGDANPMTLNHPGTQTHVFLEYAADSNLIGKDLEFSLSLNSDTSLIMPPIRVQSNFETLAIPLGEYIRSAYPITAIQVKVLNPAKPSELSGTFTMKNACFKFYSSSTYSKVSLNSVQNSEFVKYQTSTSTVSIFDNDFIGLEISALNKPIYVKFNMISNGNVYTHSSPIGVNQTGTVSVLGINMKNGASSVAQKPISEIQVRFYSQDASNGLMIEFRELKHTPSTYSGRPTRIIASSVETDSKKTISVSNPVNSTLNLKTDVMDQSGTLLFDFFNGSGPLQ